VDFRLTEDQQALREGVRSFCEGQMPDGKLRELEGEDAFDRHLWSELSAMGVFSLRLGEDAGGVGLGTSDAVLVFAELGRRLVPGPVIWSHLGAGLVDGAASGECVVGGLDRMGPCQDDPVLVEHLGSLDALLVLRPDGVFQIDSRSLDATPVGVPLDPLTPLHHVEILPEGERLGDVELAVQLRRDGAALASGFLLGICETTLELANDYARSREQFGRPIGGFQAVKHILADMFVRQEAARAATYAAGVVLDQPDVDDVERVVASAKLVSGESALKNCRACIQVHGGTGYTWEVPVHYYLKRTWVLETVFGTVEECAERVAERIERGTEDGPARL